MYLETILHRIELNLFMEKNVWWFSKMNDSQSNKYFPIYLNTIRAYTLKTFSIYLRVKNNFVLYHSKGEKLTEKIIKNLIDNKINIIYVNKNETEDYNRYLLENLSVILSDPNIGIEEKAAIAYSSLTSTAEALFENPSRVSLKIFKYSIATITDFVIMYNNAIQNIIRLTSHKFKISVHSINVGLFALGLAKTLLGSDPSHNLHDIASGFFLHDIGKCTIPDEILHKPGALTYNEWNIIKQHPREGYKLLNRFSALNEDIKTIVMQHHERADGRGYPQGMKQDKIHIYGRICAIADVFEALTSHRPYRSQNSNGLSSFRAFMTMQDEMKNEFDPVFFSQFVLLFSDHKK